MPTYRVTDPESGKTIKLTGDSPPTEQELIEIFGEIKSSQAPQEPGSNIEGFPELIDTAGLNRRDQRQTEMKNRQIRKDRIELFRQKSQEMGVPFARDLEEIGNAPELNELSRKSFLASLGASFTFDDEEVGDILKEQIGADVIRDAEGNFIAQLPSGSFAINRPDFSAQDVTKGITNALSFTPAGRLTGLGSQIAGGIATQGGIELAQDKLGGEVDFTDIGTAALAPVAIGVGSSVLKTASTRSKAVTDYLEEKLATSQKTDAIESPSITNELVTPAGSLAQKAEAFAFNEGAKKSELRRSIKEGTTDAVGFTVNDRGHIIKDKLQRNLIKKGVDEKFIASTNTMTKEDKAAGLEMVNLAEDFIRGVKGSEIRRPQLVIGQNAMKRFNVIKDAQNKASKDVGLAVEKDLKSNSIDLTDDLDNFMDDMELLGIQFNGNGINFKESIIRGSNVTPIRNVFEMMKPSYDSAADAHRLKQAITKQINFDNPSKGPLDSEAERALKSLRASINEKLRGMSDSYADANDRFAKAAQVLEPWAKDMGRRFDPASDRVENLVGQELRKTITNYGKSNDLIMRINELDAVAREFGTEFNDDIMAQVMLNDQLQRLFGSFAPGSMQGVTEAGMGVAIDQVAGAASPVVKAGLNQAGNRLRFKKPTKEKLDLLREIKTLLSR